MEQQTKKRLIEIVESTLIAWGLMQITGLTPRHLLVAVYFLLAFLLIQKTNSMQTHSRQVKGMGLLFTFFYLCGDFERICGELNNRFFRLFILVMTGIGLFLLFTRVLRFLFHVTSELSFPKHTQSRLQKLRHFQFGLLSFFVCLLGYLPYFLKGFPGIMTVDSMNQYAQIIGIYGQSNHHPWLHTILIKLFYQIGMFFTKDPTCSIAFYTVAQMCFMAFCVSCLMHYLHRKQLPDWIYVLVLAFYALVPYNGAFAISMIKDAPFGGFVLLFTLSLLSLLSITQNEHLSLRLHWKSLIFFIITSVFFCLMRSNGFYAFLFLVPFIIFIFRKDWKPMLSSIVVALALVMLFKGPVMQAYHVTSPDLVENLSMPGQQISRVIIKHRDLTPEQSAFLNQIMDTSRMEEGYNPYVSDWFKRLVRMGDQNYLEEHFGEFLKIYVEIGLKYPGDYLIAYRDQTIGYFFPLSDQAEIALNEGVCENEFGLQSRPVLKGPLVIKINEVLFKLHFIFPIYGLLWSAGAIFWIILVLMNISGIRGSARYLLLYLPAIGIFLTLLLATPVSKDFRYAYGYIFCLPFYLIFPFLLEPGSASCNSIAHKEN